jgi:nucleoside 2-deoxyribosyltransferase
VKTLYLAGPEVFAPDAAAKFERLLAVCAAEGLQGKVPVDGGLSAGAQPNPETAMRIYRGNIALIDECDAVAANISAFRGSEPDSGTCWEIGYAVARGKPVVLYIDDSLSYAERVEKTVGSVESEHGTVCKPHGWFIESMGLEANLMLACSTKGVFTRFEAAVEYLASHFAAQEVVPTAEVAA